MTQSFTNDEYDKMRCYVEKDYRSNEEEEARVRRRRVSLRLAAAILGCLVLVVLPQPILSSSIHHSHRTSSSSLPSSFPSYPLYPFVGRRSFPPSQHHHQQVPPAHHDQDRSNRILYMDAEDERGGRGHLDDLMDLDDILGLGGQQERREEEEQDGRDGREVYRSMGKTAAARRLVADLNHAGAVANDLRDEYNQLVDDLRHNRIQSSGGGGGGGRNVREERVAGGGILDHAQVLEMLEGLGKYINS